MASKLKSVLSAAAAIAALSAMSALAPASAEEAAATTEAADPAATEEQAKADAIALITGMNEGAGAVTTEGSRVEHVQQVLGDSLAIDYLAAFLIDTHREDFTPEQIAAYREVFPEYITYFFAKQFDGLVGKPLEVVEARVRRNGDILVITKYERTDEKPLDVIWQVHKMRNGESRIIDIIVSLTSIMTVRRQEFSQVIQAEGVDGFLQILREKSGPLGEAAVDTGAN